jgi:hypothetical protein
MHNIPPRPTSRKTFMAIAVASLIIFLAIGVAAKSQVQTDWRQWTKTDVHKILSASPWVSSCCRTWLGGGESIPPDTGDIAVIVSSQTVREALVRNLQLDKRYEKLDPARHQEVDQRINSCLSEKFDDYIVFSFSFLGNSPSGPTFKDKLFVSNLYVVTSDGRRIAGHLTPVSTTMTCGAFPQDPGLASLWPLWNNLSSPWWPLGPGKEVAFPRFVDGKPTIARDDKTIRIHLDRNGGSEAHPAKYVSIDFSIDKLIYQGKPDF